VLGGLADVERDLIRTRTAEGRSRAQKCGQRMGSYLRSIAFGIVLGKCLMHRHFLEQGDREDL
jgi:hypothetical protein